MHSYRHLSHSRASRVRSLTGIRRAHSATGSGSRGHTEEPPRDSLPGLTHGLRCVPARDVIVPPHGALGGTVATREVAAREKNPDDIGMPTRMEVRTKCKCEDKIDDARLAENDWISSLMIARQEDLSEYCPVGHGKVRLQGSNALQNFRPICI